MDLFFNRLIAGGGGAVDEGRAGQALPEDHTEAQARPGGWAVGLV